MKAYLIGCSMLVFGLAMVGLAAYFESAGEATAALVVGITGAAVFVVGGGGWMLWWVVKAGKREIPEEELDDGEVVWAKTTEGVGHWRSWGMTGGKLFLTNKALEFRANPGQPSTHRLKIPFRSIRRVRPIRILFLIPGGLCVERRDGSSEVFHFGPVANLSREWADAIIAFCEDLDEAEPD